jgi:hypothetical protein
MRIFSEDIGKLFFFSAVLGGLFLGFFSELKLKEPLSLYAIMGFQLALLIRWFRLDSLKRGYGDIADRGWFMMMAGHIILPLYLLWTRKLRGLWLLTLALLCYFVPALIMALIMALAS